MQGDLLQKKKMIKKSGVEKTEIYTPQSKGECSERDEWKVNG